jgi:hypothetical protein
LRGDPKSDYVRVPEDEEEPGGIRLADLEGVNVNREVLSAGRTWEEDLHGDMLG